MERQRIIKTVTHPLFIGAIITALFLILWFPDFSRYRIRPVDTLLTPGVTQVYFSDLDQDGESEEISVDVIPTLLKILVLKERGVITQMNLRSRPVAAEFLYTGDHDGDGNLEIYLLTLKNDSVLLSILDLAHRDHFILNERLVFHSDTIHYEIDIPQGEFAGLVDFGDGRGRTLVFSLTSGYSKRPRTVYRYDIKRDELMESPLSGVSIHQTMIGDINADSIPEILIHTAATGNYPASFPHSDSSAWLMVLDREMQYLFEPVEFKGYPSSIQLAILPSPSSTELVVLHHNLDDHASGAALYRYDHRGAPLGYRALEGMQRDSYFLTVAQGKKGPRILLMNSQQRAIARMDPQLEELAFRSMPPLFRAKPVAVLDIDLDGREEFIFNGVKNGTFTIFSSDLRHPVPVDLEQAHYPLHYSHVIRDGKGYLYAQYEDAGFLASYEKNPMYFLRIPLFILLYGLISALVYMVFRIQKYRAEIQYRTQRKINELQILSLKNQIDPHFTFNVVNTMGSLYAREADQKKTYDLFVSYSRLLRQAIQHSDRISVTLSEELDFVKNYMELEQLRGDAPFTGQVESDAEADLTLRIPRMLIHTFVENSIKHGIRAAGEAGELTVRISRTRTGHVVRIRNNGPGPDHQPAGKPFSTGKGLQIVDELIALFNKLEGTRIFYSIRDLQHETGRPGAEVEVVLPERTRSHRIT